MKAVVLSGGGSKGAFQIGVLRTLLDKDPNYDADVWSGVSVGALNSSLLATGPLKKTLPELEDIWFNDVHGNHSIWTHHLWRYILFGICVIVLFIILAFVSFILSAPKWLTIILGLLAIGSFYIPYYSLNNTHSIYNTDPLRKLIDHKLDLDKLKASGKKLLIGAVSFTTGKYRSVDESNKDLKNWIMASSAFPVFFPMEYIDGEYWTDGGVIEVAPLSDVISMGATEIDIILASPIESSEFYGLPGILKQLQRNLDIMSSEVLKNDVNLRCSMVPGIRIRVFAPEYQLTSNSLDFDKDKIRRMYEEGKCIANKIVK